MKKLLTVFLTASLLLTSGSNVFALMDDEDENKGLLNEEVEETTNWEDAGTIYDDSDSVTVDINYTATNISDADKTDADDSDVADIKDVIYVTVESAITDGQVEINHTYSQANGLWTEEKSFGEMTAGTASFKITNYSYDDVTANISFDPVTEVTHSFNEFPYTIYSAFDDNFGDTVWTTPTTFNSITADYTIDFNDDFTVEEAEKALEEAQKMGTFTITINSNGCFAAGTKITMADGSLKNIEDVVEGDKVLSFNHETGEYEANEVVFVYEGEEKATFNLTFDNGTELAIYDKHDLFCLEDATYVTITNVNAEDYIGKHFYSVEDGYVELVDVTYNNEAVKHYSLYIANTANCIANGMLSVPDGDDERLQMYKFNEDLTIDQEQLAADIATYGLVERKTFSEEDFNNWSLKYVNIMIGKGLVTLDEMYARNAETK